MIYSLSYSPYGWGGSRPEHPMLKFNGEMRDNVSGGYHLGQGKRLYLPGTMRFTSPDDFSPFLRGGINCYAYCAGDPVNYTDPSGRSGVRTLYKLSKRVVKHDPRLRNSGSLPAKIESDLLPAPVTRAGLEEYKTAKAQAENKTADELLDLYPHLKRYIKHHSRHFALNMSPDPGFISSSRHVLSKHKELAIRYIPFRLEAAKPEYRSTPKLPKSIHGIPLIHSTILDYGFTKGLKLAPDDARKIIRWNIKSLEFHKDSPIMLRISRNWAA